MGRLVHGFRVKACWNAKLEMVVRRKNNKTPRNM